MPRETSPTDTSFSALMQRVRAGDPEAAELLVRTYEPDIRRAIRVRMVDSRLRRLLDSMDVCQSILGNFFVRAAAGQFDVETPDQLLKLLVTMARNRITDWARRGLAEKRDGRRDVALDALGDSAVAPPADTPTPSAVVANRELLGELQRRLTPDERQIVQWRSEGESWAQIAERFGAQANSVRMRLMRALDRVSDELKLGESINL